MPVDSELFQPPSLVAVQLAVAVMIDAEAMAKANRHARKGQLGTGTRRLRQRLPGERRFILAIRLKHPIADVNKAAMLALIDAFDDNVAIANAGLVNQKLNALGGGLILLRAIDCDLQADRRRDAAIKGHHKRGDVAAVIVIPEGEDRHAQEIKQTVHRAVVDKAKAGELLAGGIDHADLLIESAQLRHLEILRLLQEQSGDNQVVGP